MRKGILMMLVMAGLVFAEPIGEYKVSCENLATREQYTEDVVIYEFPDGTFLVELTRGDDFSSKEGIEENGLIFVSSLFSGNAINIFMIEGEELHGLEVTWDGEVTVKTSSGLSPLELSPLYTPHAGWFVSRGAAEDSSFVYSDTVILEPDGEVWWDVFHVRHTDDHPGMPGIIERTGFGISVDGLLAFTYGSYLKIFEIKDETFEGRWIVYYWDTETNSAVVTKGWEILTPIPDISE